MEQPIRVNSDRRAFVRLLLALPGWLVLAACGVRQSEGAAPATAALPRPTRAPATAAAPATTQAPAQPAPTAPPVSQAQALQPTPACVDQDDVTPAQAAGPFFKPNSPRRSSLLEPGLAGTKMVLSGSVLTTDCKPVANALLDFWHADDAGAYDNNGFKLRGHQFTDDQGRYVLETIVPGLYPGRTRHFHVRAQAPNGPILTTQLYFPDEPGNRGDSIFNPALVIAVQDKGNEKTGSFDFVVNA